MNLNVRIGNTSRLQASLSSGDPYQRTRAILDRNLNKSKNDQVSLAAFAFLFSEIVQYTQKRVTGIADLERKLNVVGYRVGQRYLELLFFRDRGGTNVKRETRVLQMLLFINTVVWKALFGKQADSLEKSTDNEDEYMISDNDLLVNRFISVPKDLSQLNAGAFVAGIVEAMLEGSQFPARVTAHTVPVEGMPNRTTVLIKFEASVMQREALLDELQQMAVSLLSYAGMRIPRHVAFIMDGNRRYACKRNLPREKGHYKGFESLEQTLEWCMKLGIRAVTVYAFAISNFQRNSQEVSFLFRLLVEKMQELSEKSELVKRHQVSIRIVGDVMLLPSEVRNAALKAQEQTKFYKGSILSICIAYSSRHEITHALTSVQKSIENDIIQPRDVNEQMIENYLQTDHEIGPIDILIRTSGEIRLSDFLLWQVCNGTRIHFVSTSWPEFSFWDFLPLLLDYQLSSIFSTPSPQVM